MDIYDKTPYKSYEDLIQAVNSGEAKFSYWRAAAFDAASGISKVSFFAFYLGLLLSVGTLIALSAYSENYWTLLFIPVMFVLYANIHRLTTFVILCAISSALAMWIHAPFWIVILLVSIVLLYFAYHVWWGITTNIVEEELLKNKQLFVSMWTAHCLGIKDNEGNFYTSKKVKNRSD